MQTASLILGVLALAFLFVPGANLVLSPMMAVGALVMGIIGMKQAQDKEEDVMMGKAGFITGIIALSLSLILIGACVAIVKTADCCDWKKKKEEAKAAEVQFEELSEDFKEELRQEIRREIEQEMDRARKDRLQHWEKKEPWSDEEWREDFEQRLDEWVDWIEEMPLHKDIEEAAGEGEAEEKEEPEKPTPPPAGKKPPAKLPDKEYPLVEEYPLLE